MSIFCRRSNRLHLRCWYILTMSHPASSSSAASASAAIDLLHSKSYSEFISFIRSSNIRDALHDEDGWSCVHWASYAPPHPLLSPVFSSEQKFLVLNRSVLDEPTTTQVLRQARLRCRHVRGVSHHRRKRPHFAAAKVLAVLQWHCATLALKCEWA